MKKNDTLLTAELICKDFQLEPTQHVSDEALLSWLEKVIDYLLDHNFESLMQAMYRIDIDEHQFKKTLAYETNVAQQLAELVFKRELEKVQLRKKYSSL